MIKFCNKCKLWKADMMFGVDRSKKCGLKCWCKPCANSTTRAWQVLNPEKFSAYQAKRKREKPELVAAQKRKSIYGMPYESFPAMVSLQKGRCKICKQRPPKLTVDHCHKTGQVRGLLCGNCNRALGLFQESPEALLAAARYLKENKNKKN